MASIDPTDHGKHKVRWRDPDGRARSRTFNRKTEAAAHKREVEDAKARGRRWAAPDRDPTPGLKEACEAFLLDRRADGYRHGTQRANQSSLNRSIRYFGPSAPITSLDRTALLKFREHLQAEGLAIRTIKKYEGDLYSLLTWLSEHERYGLQYRRPRRPRGLEPQSPAPVPVGWAEVDAFIRVAMLSKRCQWAWKLAVLMRYTGMRCNEARLVRWDHVQNGWIHLPAELCKTRRARKIPIAGDLLAFLDEWRDHSGWLVPDLPDGARYKRSTVIQAFSRFWEKAHLEARVPREAFGHIPGRANSSPTHTFRNCFSSQLKRAGARWEAVEAILGHYSSIGVASHYDFLDDLMLKAVELVPPLNSEAQTFIALTAAR